MDFLFFVDIYLQRAYKFLLFLMNYEKVGAFFVKELFSLIINNIFFKYSLIFIQRVSQIINHKRDIVFIYAKF